MRGPCPEEVFLGGAPCHCSSGRNPRGCPLPAAPVVGELSKTGQAAWAPDTPEYGRREDGPKWEVPPVINERCSFHGLSNFSLQLRDGGIAGCMYNWETQRND